MCQPFYHVSREWSAWRYIAPIVILAFVYNMPKFFELRYVPSIEVLSPGTPCCTRGQVVLM